MPFNVAILLDLPLIEGEIKDCIGLLKIGKISYLDATPDEFFKDYVDFLCPFILLV